MKHDNIKSALTAMLKNSGASLVGFSDISGVPADNRKGLPCAVTIVCALDKDAVGSIQDAPTDAYYEEYNRKNALLNELGQKCADYLKLNGFKAQTLPTTEVGIDCNLETPFPHKTGAVLSGLGWIGKCALLITKEFGSAHRLTTVFTDMPCENGELVENLCGSCTECVIACPGNALTGRNFEHGMSRSEIYDAFACQKTAYEQAAKIGVRNTICGICIASCPWTIKYVNDLVTI